jgi:hypothetical protein
MNRRDAASVRIDVLEEDGRGQACILVFLRRQARRGFAAEIW